MRIFGTIALGACALVLSLPAWPPRTAGSYRRHSCNNARNARPGSRGALFACILLAVTGLLPGWPVSAEVRSDGAVDLSTLPVEFQNGDVFRSLRQSDGKLIVAGVFAKLHGVERTRIARINQNGSLDMSFAPWPGMYSSYVAGMRQVGSGQLLVWGNFSGAPPFSYPPPLIVRLNWDGSADGTFNVGRVLAATVGDDGTLRLWPAPQAWADRLCGKLVRNMSRLQWREWVSSEIPYTCQCPELPLTPDAAGGGAAAGR